MMTTPIFDSINARFMIGAGDYITMYVSCKIDEAFDDDASIKIESIINDFMIDDHDMEDAIDFGFEMAYLKEDAKFIFMSYNQAMIDARMEAISINWAA